MATFVLIHGGWAGAWSWEKLTPLLESRGHRVVTPDLPGRGNDRTPVSALTLRAYVDRVVDVLDAEREPVMLVGHSSSGIVITEAAERRPDRVKKLLYLCAYLPASGQSLLALGQTDREGLVVANLVPSEDRTTVGLDPKIVREALFEDCTMEDHERALPRFTHGEPFALASTPVEVTEARYGRIPRVYIMCNRDRALSPALQRRMIEAVPCEMVIEMDTGHFPHYAAPNELADRLAAAC